MSKRVVSSPETISATSFGVSFDKHTKEMTGQTRSKSCQSRRPNQNINATDKFSRRTENINIYEDRISNGIDSIRIAETGIRYQTDGKENNESETNSNLTSVTSKCVSESRNVCSYENSKKKSVNSRHMYIRTENASTTEDEDSNDTSFKTVAGVKIRNHNNVKANNEGKVNQNLTNFNTKLESKPRNFHSYQNSENKIMNAKDIYSKTIENGTTTEDQEKNDTGFKIVAGIRIRNQTDIKANNERGLNQSLIDLATVLESKPTDFYSENENVNSRRTQNENITEDNKNNDHDFKIVAGVRIRNEADITAYNEKKRNQSLINLTTILAGIRIRNEADITTYNEKKRNQSLINLTTKNTNGNITEDHNNNDHDFKTLAGIKIRNQTNVKENNEEEVNFTMLSTRCKSKPRNYHPYQNFKNKSVTARDVFSRNIENLSINKDLQNNCTDSKIVAGTRIRNLPVEENVKMNDDLHFADSNTSCESTVNDFCCPYSEKSDSNSGGFVFKKDRKWKCYSRQKP
ncbi:hypothetical protein CEXT_275991 [Caerostris extrusa]|uniref:Uncharacterized protein n=1 Tax=Caerostris extrusa TaxID=172846 RepID=A0AAV4SJA6_CAEEX|nr:hypothetical protein CEXT_275991 [Caerostris extrusa]